MEQWNTRPPVLYLWSHPDWSAEHKAIAEKYGHIFRQEEPTEHIPSNTIIPECPTGNHDDYVDNSMLISDDLPLQTDNIEGIIDWAFRTEGHDERPLVGSGDGRSCENYDLGKNQCSEKSGNQPKEKSGKQQRGKKKQRREKSEVSAENRLNGGRERQRGMPPPNKADRNIRQHFEPSKNGRDDLCVQLETANAAYQASLPDNLSRRYSWNVDDNYSSATNRWSSSVSPASDYGIRNLEDMGRMRENTDTFGYRPPYISDMEERLRRETRGHIYGQNSDPLVSTSLVGQDSRYGQIGSLPPIPSPCGINISATQRYAPRLDDWNPTRTSGLGSEPPMFAGNGFYDSRAPPPGYGGGRMGFSPSHASPGGSLGFAPGPHQTLPGGPLGFVPSPSPYQAYPSGSSGGWLND